MDVGATQATTPAAGGAPGEGQGHHLCLLSQSRRLWSPRGLQQHDQALTRAHLCIAGHQASMCFALRMFFPGGYTGEVTPVPIPNTEVKLSRANGTAGATLWESRTLPGF